MNPAPNDRKETALPLAAYCSRLLGIFASALDQVYDDGFNTALLVSVVGTLLFMAAALFIFARVLLQATGNCEAFREAADGRSPPVTAIAIGACSAGGRGRSAS